MADLTQIVLPESTRAAVQAALATYGTQPTVPINDGPGKIEPTQTTLTTEQIAELKARPESQIPEWKTPSHQEIDLATVSHEDLGLDPNNWSDPLVRKIYEAQDQKQSKSLVDNLLPMVPGELKQQNRWLTWSGDPGHKQPFISGTFNPASTNNPEHLVSFETAALNIKKQLGYLHLGFVPTRPYYGLDLDSCRNPETGEVQEWATELLKLVGPTYVEITPSLSGLRPWVKLDFKPSQKKYFINPALAAVASKAPNVQVLADNYGTITGEPFLNAPNTITVITEKQWVEIEKLLRSLAPVEQTTSSSGDDGSRVERPYIKAIKAADGDIETLLAGLPDVQDGDRDNYLTSVAGNLRQGSKLHEPWSRENGLLGLQAINEQKCHPPKIDKNGAPAPVRIVNSIWKHEVKDNTPVPVLLGRQNTVPVIKASSDSVQVEEQVTDPIPPFDPSVVNGIYKKFVEVATRGTTLDPQFVYAIAKTIVGARMAGKVKFENLDVEPRFYTALIGETGSGKGEAWRRVFQILNVEGQVGNVPASRLKVINSADSGAGIRDAFFDPPEELPMLIYIDEVESFGNKAAATRNPAILDMLIELADTTQISRVKSRKTEGLSGVKTKNDARLCAVMCGQEGSVYMKAFAGRTKLGLWDRLYPEYGAPVEPGDLPPISAEAAYKLLSELNSLDYSGTMTMQPEAKARLDKFWSGQLDTVRKKARWKKNLMLDAYMSAFGRGLKVVELEDAEIAIKIFPRQLVIRQTHFTTEVPDRIGYYLGLMKAISERMGQRLAAGVPVDQVAKSRRDFERETHAHRDNEAHIFERAWAVYAPTWLTSVQVQKTNGQSYIKYLPADDE